MAGGVQEVEGMKTKTSTRLFKQANEARRMASQAGARGDEQERTAQLERYVALVTRGNEAALRGE